MKRSENRGFPRGRPETPNSPVVEGTIKTKRVLGKEFPRGRDEMKKCSVVEGTKKSIPVKEFPRGRLQTTSNVVASTVVVSDDEKDLFRENNAGASKSKKKKHKKKNKLNDEDNAVLANGFNSQRRDFNIDTLSYDQITVGFLSLGIVYQIRDLEMIISLPGRIVGKVTHKNISEPYTKMVEDIADGLYYKGGHSISDMFRIGQVVIVKVIGEETTEKGKQLHLSMSPSEIHEDYTASAISKNTIMTCAVKSIEDHGYSMDMGIKGVNAFLKFEDSFLYERTVNLNQKLRLGQLVECKVLDAKTQRLNATVKLTANPKHIWNHIIPDETMANYNLLIPGWLVNGTVMDNHRTGMKVHFLDMTGLIHEDHMKDPWESPINLEIGSTTYPRILYKFPTGTSPYLTLKTHMAPYKSNDKPNIVIGEKYKCKIHLIEKRGLIIKLETGDKGIVFAQNCSDDGTWTDEDIGKNFPVGSTHECRVRSYTLVDQMFIASFQKIHMEENLHHIGQLKVGQKLNASVLKMNKGGVVVRMGKVLSAFIPNSLFPDALRKRLAHQGANKEFLTMVKELNISQNRIILSANKKDWANTIESKPIKSHDDEPKSPAIFNTESSDRDDNHSTPTRQAKAKRAGTKKEAIKKEAQTMKRALDFDSKREAKRARLTANPKVDKNVDAINYELKTMDGLTNFWENAPFWNQENADDLENLIDPSDTHIPELTTKVVRTAASRELEMRNIEARMADDTSVPTSNVEFERQIMAHPNSSIGWIQYIAFHLAAAEIDKARGIARRAIEKISHREENELLNVWAAFLSLENDHGTEDSMNDLIKEAVQRNDEVELTFRIIDIFVKSNKNDKAEQFLKKLLKKFHREVRVWEKYVTFCFHSKKYTEGRKLVSQCNASLSIADYLYIASKAVGLEFSNGEIEKGKTLMDSILEYNAKRTDLWIVYVNLLIKAKDISGARQIYERALTTNMKFKKVKKLSEHFFEFEKKFGTDVTLQKAKKTVIERLSDENRN